MRLNEKIKAFRIAQGLTQAELATEIGIAQNTIAQYETGQRRPSVDKIPKLATALKCQIADLF